MLQGVVIDGIDTLTSMGLLLLDDVKISTAIKRENRVIVPGMSGSLDLSEAISDEPVYEDREISFTLFAALDDSELEERREELHRRWHGQTVRLQLPEDASHYWNGELQVGERSGWRSGRIPIVVRVGPYKLKLEPTTVCLTDLTTSWQTLQLSNEARRVVPTIAVTAPTSVEWNGAVYPLTAGENRLRDIYLRPGTNELKARLLTSGSGSITVTYQEASL